MLLEAIIGAGLKAL
jgi:hypothetical protein